MNVLNVLNVSFLGEDWLINISERLGLEATMHRAVVRSESEKTPDPFSELRDQFVREAEAVLQQDYLASRSPIFLIAIHPT